MPAFTAEAPSVQFTPELTRLCILVFLPLHVTRCSSCHFALAPRKHHSVLTFETPKRSFPKSPCTHSLPTGPLGLGSQKRFPARPAWSQRYSALCPQSTTLAVKQQHEAGPVTRLTLDWCLLITCQACTGVPRTDESQSPLSGYPRQLGSRMLQGPG